MTHRGAWNSRWSFVLATTGSAIGLGNIWKLPYMIGVNGGSAFVLIYILSILCVGIPLLMTEIMLGRRVQKKSNRCDEKPGKRVKPLQQLEVCRWHGHANGCDDFMLL